MNCPEFQEHLESFLDGQLTRTDEEGLHAHARECKQCGTHLEDARFSQTVIRTAYPAGELAASPQFFSRLWQSIEREQSEPFSWLAIRGLALRFVSGVVLLVVLLVAIDAVSGPRLNANQAAINSYLEAPGAPDSFRDILIGDVATNRDELLRDLLQRDRQQSASPISTHEVFKKPEPKNK
jgi:hypothetical protein